MKILLTGATGFLGSHVAEQLTKQGHIVRCLVRATSDKRFLAQLSNIEFSEGHITDEASLARAVHGVDAVIHAAGLVKARSPMEFQTINVAGTIHLLNAARQQAAHLKRFILVSSLAAIGPTPDGTPVTEINVRHPNPVTYYGRSKLEAEQQALTFAGQLPITIMRPPLIYGPRDKECLAFFQLIQYKIFPFFGSKQNTASVIYGADAAAALCQAIHADVASGSAYFIEDGQTLSIETRVNQLAAAMRTQLWFTPQLPVALLKPIAMASEYYGKLANKSVMLTRDKLHELTQPHWVCNNTKAQRELNWRPATDWASGTKLTYDWYKRAGWLK